MTFVDTNYFIRFLIKDILQQHKKAKDLFEKGIAGEVKLYASVVVFFELFWVFSSYYEKNKNEVIDILQKVLKMDFIQLENRKLLMESLDLFKESSLKFEDCYNVTLSKQLKCNDFATFEKKLSKFV